MGQIRGTPVGVLPVVVAAPPTWRGGVLAQQAVALLQDSERLSPAGQSARRAARGYFSVKEAALRFIQHNHELQ
jgi:hypothetical protein